jgi:DNA-binding NtrC family response regulator
MRQRPAGRREKVPRVLIIEDDPALADLMRQVLEDDGFQTEVVTRLDQVQAALNADSYVLLVADLVEADLHGSDAVVRDLTVLAAGRPLIICTGQPRAQEFGALEGVADVVDKPFDLDDLLGSVRSALANRT